ncbi:MAG: T9SS type A sorting domain-containing protein [Bacteroidales bacterium]
MNNKFTLIAILFCFSSMLTMGQHFSTTKQEFKNYQNKIGGTLDSIYIHYIGIPGTDLIESKVIFQSNEDGFLTLCKKYNSNYLEEKEIYKRDKKNNVILFEYYNKKNEDKLSLRNRVEYKRNAKGLVEKKSEVKDYTTNETLYTYFDNDSIKTIESKILTNSNKKVVSESFTEYTSFHKVKTNIVYIIRKNGDKTISSKEEYNYNDNQLITDKKSYKTIPYETELILNNKTEYKYNNKGLLIQEVHYRLNIDDSSLFASAKNEYEYSGKNCIKDTFYEFDVSINSWTIAIEKTYVFNSSNKCVQSKESGFDRNNKLIAQSVLTSNYNSDEQLLNEKLQTLRFSADHPEGKLFTENLWEYEYNNKKLLYKAIKTFGNVEQGPEYGSKQQEIFSYKYDIKDRMIEKESLFISDNSTYGNSVETWVYDNNDNLIDHKIASDSDQYKNTEEVKVLNLCLKLNKDNMAPMALKYLDENNVKNPILEKIKTTKKVNKNYNTEDNQEVKTYYYYTLEDGVGVNNIPSNSSILVYPNPAQNNIQVNLPKNATATKVSLIDLKGNLWKETELNESDNIYVGDLPRGLYLCKFTSINSVIIKKIILEK